MRIGIIGAGQIGGTLARRLTALGHEVAIANSRGPQSLAGLAEETGARPVMVEEGATESRWVSEQLGRLVVKAFNNIYARHLLERGKPKGAADRIALPVAGDDPRAKEIVIRLLDQLGFDGVDAGTLDESWRQQPGTAVYGTDLDARRLQKALKEAKPGRPAEFRAKGEAVRR